MELGDNIQEVELMQGEESVDTLKVSDDLSYNGIDLANMDASVYCNRRIYLPSNYATTMHLDVSFALYDSARDEMNTLEQLDYSVSPSNREKQLIQLWFKEIDGLVYVFQVYHLTDYSYLLNVVCVQKNVVTHIHRELLLPQLGFELKEG